MERYVNDMRSQTGTALYEILIALAITAMLGAGLTMFVAQAFQQSIRSRTVMHEVQQVENAGWWVSRDVQMAKTISTGPAAGFPLRLAWTDYDDNSFNVTFTLDDGHLYRSLVENGGAPVQTFVAQSISLSPSLTYCSYNNGLLTFGITAASGSDTLSRTYQIKKRTW